MISPLLMLIHLATLIQDEAPSTILNVSNDFTHFLVDGRNDDTLEIWTTKKRNFTFESDVASFTLIDGKSRLVSAKIQSLISPELFVTIRDLDNKVIAERQFKMSELAAISPALFGYKINSIHATSDGRVMIDFSNNSLIEFAMDSGTFNYIFVFGSKIAIYTEKEINALPKTSRDRLVTYATNSAINFSLSTMDDSWVFDGQRVSSIDDLKNSESIDVNSFPTDPSAGCFAVINCENGALISEALFTPVFLKDTASYLTTAGAMQNRTKGKTQFLQLEWASNRELKIARFSQSEDKLSKSNGTQAISIKPDRGEEFIRLAAPLNTTNDYKNIFLALKTSNGLSVYQMSDKFNVTKVAKFTNDFDTMRVLNDRLVFLKEDSMQLQFLKFDESQVREFTLVK